MYVHLPFMLRDFIVYFKHNNYINTFHIQRFTNNCPVLGCHLTITYTQALERYSPLHSLTIRL